MKNKEVKAKLKSLDINGEYTKRKSQLEIKVDPTSFDAVSQNIQELKSIGFFMRLYGQCTQNNLNPASPSEMERCDSCYLTITTWG